MNSRHETSNIFRFTMLKFWICRIILWNTLPFLIIGVVLMLWGNVENHLGTGSVDWLLVGILFSISVGGAV